MTSRTGIKANFETGDTPTQSQFGDLIDSLAHKTDDGIALGPALLADFVDASYRASSLSVADLAAWLTATSGTFTRGGSNHRYIDASGYLANGSADTLRVTYDPVTLKLVGALLEPSRQNLITYSDVISDAKWAFSNINITRTANNAVGIAGTTTAATVVETTAANVQHRLWWYDAAVSVTSGNVYCYSVYLKSIGGRDVQLEPSANTGLGTTIISFSKQRASNGWNMEKHGNDIYRVWKSAQATSTGVPNFAYYTWNGSSTTFTGTTGTGFQIEKAQLEQVTAVGDGPTSYIDNPSTTQNTRSADALAFTVPTATLYTIYGDGNWASQSVSSGSHSFVPSSTYPVVRRIATGLPFVTEVNNRLLRADVVKEDIEGLTSDDSPIFQSLVASSGDIELSTANFIRVLGTSIQITASRAGNVPSSSRSICIGYQAANASSPSNSMVVGNAAAAVATTINTSTVINDTAAATATSISNSDVIGNEAGNGHTSIASCVLVGNFAGRGHSAATAANAVVIGQTAGNLCTLSASVCIGQAAGAAPTNATLTNCTIVGSTAGDNVSGSITNLNLFGYGVQASSGTTSNYLSICDVIKSDLTGTIVEFPGTGIRISTQATPASATAAGTKGDIVHDTDYIYVCTATNTWKRAAISTW